MPKEPLPRWLVALIESAAQTGAAGAGLAVGGPPGALAGAAAGPLLSRAVQGGVQVVQERFRGNAERAVAVASEATGLDPEELVRRLVATPAGAELFWQALQAAAHATVEAKIKALGRSLARGALAEDSAALVRERHFVEAMADFDAAHIQLLSYIVQVLEAPDSVRPPSTQELGDLPWTGSALFPLLGTLERHGAVYSVGVGSLYMHAPGAASGSVLFDHGQGAPGTWMATPFGGECLQRLRQAGHDGELPNDQEDES